MKFPIITTAAVALCALSAAVQADVAIKSVSVKELYTKFYKRFETEQFLQKNRNDIVAQIKEREDKLRALSAEAEEIRKQADPSLAESAKNKLREQYQKKVDAIKAAEQERRDFIQRQSECFQKLLNQEMNVLLEEVQTAIRDVASEQGADIVLDSGSVAAQAEIGVASPVVPYIKKSFDITPEVLKRLNAKAPAGFDPQAELKNLYGEDASKLPGMDNTTATPTPAGKK